MCMYVYIYIYIYIYTGLLRAAARTALAMHIPLMGVYSHICGKHLRVGEGTVD